MGVYQCFSPRGGSALGRKPYSDCRDNHRYKNRKSPFLPRVDLSQTEELAGISVKGLDWVRFALKNSNS